MDEGAGWCQGISWYRCLQVDENSAKNLELAQQELAQYKSDLEGGNQTITSLQSELNQTKHQLSELGAELTNRDQAITQLRSQLGDTETALGEKSQVSFMLLHITYCGALYVCALLFSFACRLKKES